MYINYLTTTQYFLGLIILVVHIKNIKNITIKCNVNKFLGLPTFGKHVLLDKIICIITAIACFLGSETTRYCPPPHFLSQFPSNVNMATHKGGKGLYFVIFSLFLLFASTKLNQFLFFNRPERWGLQKAGPLAQLKVMSGLNSYRSEQKPEMFFLWLNVVVNLKFHVCLKVS